MIIFAIGALNKGKKNPEDNLLTLIYNLINFESQIKTLKNINEKFFEESLSLKKILKII